MMSSMYLSVCKFCVFALLLMLPLQGIASGPKMPGKKDRCPVCGMFVAPYPDWIATIVFNDEKQVFFDGCKDLFRYYFKLNAEQLENIDAIYVTDYYRTELVSAKEVFFVLGSDVYGPMGKELIPIAGKELAKTFMADHGGSGFFRFDEISPELLPVN